MDINKIISSLKRKTNSDDVEHVTTFRVARTNNKDKKDQDIDVLIFDAGEDSDPKYRYYCMAKFDDGENTTGNPSDSIESALMEVHWGDLDKHRD